MKKFLVLYMAPMSGAAQMQSMQPEEMQKNLGPWVEWYNKAGDAVVDAGAPLGETVHVGGTDHGPMMGHVSGYTIIQAEDMEAAKALLDGHPHLEMPSSCIEMLEMLPMPGM
jgi:hypothetical protein